MLPDQVSNPGPLTYESGALPIALRGPANSINKKSDSINVGLPSQHWYGALFTYTLFRGAFVACWPAELAISGSRDLRF